MNKLRMRFAKTGRAIYISHLDLMHTMQRAFNRAGLDLAYSEGFNPHPLISIALPLSVGASSVCEIMDFRLRNDADIVEIPARLTAVMPEGIEVYEVYEADVKASNIKWLAIDGVFEYDTRDCSEMAAKLTEFFSAEQITMEKKTKRGFGITDIKPGIANLQFEAGEGFVRVKAVLSAAEPTINPDLLVGALRQNEPALEPDFARFERKEVYYANMEIFR